MFHVGRNVVTMTDAIVFSSNACALPCSNTNCWLRESESLSFVQLLCGHVLPGTHGPSPAHDGLWLLQANHSVSPHCPTGRARAAVLNKEQEGTPREASGQGFMTDKERPRRKCIFFCLWVLSSAGASGIVAASTSSRQAEDNRAETVETPDL